MGAYTIELVKPDSLVRRLEKAYANLQANRTVETQEAYFEAFPSLWEDFLRIDTYDRGVSTFKQEWLDAFEGLDAINDTAFCIKSYNIRRGYDYECDPTQGRVSPYIPSPDSKDYERMRARYSTMMWLLANMPRGEQFSYWALPCSSVKFENRVGPEEEDKEYFKQMSEIVLKEQPSMQSILVDTYYNFARQIFFLNHTFDYRKFGIKTKFKIE